MVKDKITEILQLALKEINIENVNIDLDHPTNSQYGDYATSIALRLTKQLKKNPFDIAKEIVKHLPKDEIIEKVEIIKPGFINFWISNNFTINIVKQYSNEKFNYVPVHLGNQKKIIVEFAHPNTLKLFHIGHFRNITTGESIVRILEASKNKVIRANYQGDVGLHIAKCLFKVKNQKLKIKSLQTLKDKIDFIGKMYTEGTRDYEESETAKKEILEINSKIYNNDPEIMPLWEETRKWSLEYFNEIYQRVDSYFDRCYFESELPKRGIEIVNEAIKKGILEKSQGAIVFNGKKYGLDTRVFINSLGYPTYEGKELALAEKEFSDFGEIDKIIHVVTPEQTSFFKITFKVEELLNEKLYKNKQYHLAYEWVHLKAGKMSSREGNIIEANWLLDETKKSIKNKYKNDENTTELLAIAATKYSFLKHGVKSPIAFDFEESISLQGNSAPYLIYTYVRTQSVLKKSSKFSEIKIPQLSAEEQDLLRLLYQYTEVVQKSAINLSPNFIADYLFVLAQKFNLFYQKHPILIAQPEIRDFRLLLTKATGQIIKNGLYLLGIKTVEKM